MPRLKLQPLENYPFETVCRVRVTDLNYGAHLANHALAGLLHQARVELLAQLGFAELNLGDEATGLTMIDLCVQFEAEGFLGDELTIRSAFVEVKGTTFRICNEVRRTDTRIALAETGFAGFDYVKRKPVRLPEAFVEKIRIC